MKCYKIVRNENGKLSSLVKWHLSQTYAIGRTTHAPKPYLPLYAFDNLYAAERERDCMINGGIDSCILECECELSPVYKIRSFSFMYIDMNYSTKSIRDIYLFSETERNFGRLFSTVTPIRVVD